MKMLRGMFGLVSLAATWRATQCNPRLNSSLEVHGAHQQSFSQPAGGVLVKTTFSSTFRLVFLVGLEGSGHHYLTPAVNHIRPTGDDDHDYCNELKLMYKRLGIKQSMTKSPSHYRERIEDARGYMQTLAQYASSLRSKEAGAMLCDKNSYPRLSGAEKVFSYIDLGTLADLAEDEGIDLRVIYLRRPARQMIISTTVHRNFYENLTVTDDTSKGYMEYMRILFTDIAVMQSFLAGLDSKFVVCHDFNYSGDFDQASRIAEHAVPNEELAKELVVSLVKNAPEASLGQEEDLKFEDAEFTVTRLQRQLDSFEFLYCRR